VIFLASPSYICRIADSAGLIEVFPVGEPVRKHLFKRAVLFSLAKDINLPALQLKGGVTLTG
jgi:hypothetical protein